SLLQYQFEGIHKLDYQKLLITFLIFDSFFWCPLKNGETYEQYYVMMQNVNIFSNEILIYTTYHHFPHPQQFLYKFTLKLKFNLIIGINKILQIQVIQAFPLYMYFLISSFYKGQAMLLSFFFNQYYNGRSLYQIFNICNNPF
ncbi:unnamed protein product, partial (macronuclear) [Paramecium tetraurelia]